MIANDYTELRDRPKKWWVWRLGLSIPALGAAVATLVVGAAVSGGLTRVSEPLGRWTMLAALVLSLTVYLVWGKVRPGGMNFNWWLMSVADFAFRQPRRFYGLKADKEPSEIRWIVIVYDAESHSQKSVGGRA